MNVREIVKVAFEKGYWHSDGQTPHATIYSAIIREIRVFLRPSLASRRLLSCPPYRRW